jgi:hypothetical protein
MMKPSSFCLILAYTFDNDILKIKEQKTNVSIARSFDINLYFNPYSAVIGDLRHKKNT